MIAEALRHMLAAGMPHEAIVAAVADMEASIQVTDPVADKRRAYDRERKRISKADNSTGIPPDSAETAELVPVLDKETSPRPPKEINPTPRVKRAREAGARLPEDWKPSRFNDGTVAREVVDRRGQDWGRRARESFENHWRSANGPNAVKRDWQAAFANWVIEQDNRDGQRPGISMGGNRGASASGRGNTVDAAQRFIARHTSAAGQPI